MIVNKIEKISWISIFVGLVLAHCLSFVASFFPVLNLIGFVLIISLALFLALQDLRYSLLLLGLELLTGSMGYLFDIPVGGFDLSFRIAIWLIIMSVWLTRLLMQESLRRETLLFLKSKQGLYLLALFLSVVLASYLGFKNQSVNWFTEAKRWVFLLILVPAWTSFGLNQSMDLVKSVFKAGIVFLVIETLFLAYVFSHNFGESSFLLIYRWLRDSGLSEITPTSNGFWRVFMQSHIFLLPVVVILLGRLLESVKRKIFSLPVFMALVFILAVMIFSLSRSMWLGLGFIVLLFAGYHYRDWRHLIIFSSYGFLSIALALLIVWSIINAPVFSSGGVKSLNSLSERFNTTSEAAVSSRWNLLGPLLTEIGESPIFGKGFGATVIYQSNDPRIREAHAGGMFEAYAFEWGWLDIWLKLGLGGVLIYLAWLINLIVICTKEKNFIMAISLISLMIVHNFTPYLNHPLGFALIIVVILGLKLRSVNQGLA